jgi:hypothetical protein
MELLMQYSPVSHHLIFLRLREGVGMRDLVSHPHKTAGKIMVLYILIIMFLDGTQKDKRLRSE